MTTAEEWVGKLRRSMSIYKTGPDGVPIDFVGIEVEAIKREAAEEMRKRMTNHIADHLQASAQLIDDLEALPLPGDES